MQTQIIETKADIAGSSPAKVVNTTPIEAASTTGLIGSGTIFFPIC
jgi:hypothetical protein